MLDTLFTRILIAAREMRQCADSGEHPEAARIAAEAAHSEAFTRAYDGDAPWEWYDLLYSVYCTCREAARVYEFDRGAAGVALRNQLARKRFAELVATAKAAKEEVFA